MRIIMDDAGDVPAELVAKHKIVIQPVNINFGSEEFLSGIEMDRATFYARAKQVNSSNFPKTSQPNPAQFEETYRRLFAEGEKELLVVTVSERLSKTYESAINGAKAVEGLGKIHVFDSRGGSVAQGFQALEAARMAQAGKPIDQILARLEEMKAKQMVVLLIESLDFAVRGGRIPALRAALASLLNIKPVMQLKDGEIVEAGKVRTHKKAQQFMIDYIAERVGNRPTKFAYIHANAPQGVQELKGLVGSRFNVTEELVVDLCVAVAINLGPGATGLVAIPE